MAKSSKFPGMRRSGDTMGNVPESTRKQYTPMDKGRTLSRRMGSAWAPGTKSVGTTSGSSTHNDISKFQSGIRNRGPFHGPSFESLNNSRDHMQMNVPSSNNRTPSGGGTRGSKGKVLGGMTDIPSPAPRGGGRMTLKGGSGKL